MMPVTIANARYTDKDMVFSGYQVPKGVSRFDYFQIIQAM